MQFTAGTRGQQGSCTHVLGTKPANGSGVWRLGVGGRACARATCAMTHQPASLP